MITEKRLTRHFMEISDAELGSALGAWLAVCVLRFGRGNAINAIEQALERLHELPAQDSDETPTEGKPS